MKKLLVTAAVLAMAAAGVVGCAEKAEPLPGIVEVPAQSFSRAWTANLPLAKKDWLERIYVGDQVIYVYSYNRESFVLGRTGGEIQHVDEVTRPGTQVLAPVTLADGGVVYPCTDELKQFDARGHLTRTIDMDSAMRAGAVGHGHMVYVGTDTVGGTGRVQAMDLDKPYQPKTWETMTNAGLSGAPALSQGVLFVGSEDGRVYAISEDGVAVWANLPKFAFQTGDRIVADLAADEAGAYVASTDSKLYCLDRNTGRIKWQYYAGAPLQVGPVLTKDSVYQAVPNHGLACLTKGEGEFNRTPKWVINEATQFLSEDAQYAYVRLRGNILAAVDKTTGEVKFRSRRTDLDVFGTNGKDELIYAANKGGQVVAIKPVLKPGTVGELVLERIEMPLGG